MGIDQSQFSIIWAAINYWLRRKDVSLRNLAQYTDLTSKQIENGIINRDEWITSEFVHACVDRFGLTHARMRGMEDLADILTDEECIQVLIAPLTTPSQEATLW